MYIQDNSKVFHHVLETPVGPVDKNTGELLCNEGVFITKEESQRRKIYFKKEQVKNETDKQKLRNENTKLAKIIDDAGMPIIPDKFYSRFIWAFFQEQQSLFPDLKSQDVCRLIYLSTYCSYNTNTLIKDGKNIQQEDLRKIMCLNRQTFNDWINKMTTLNYIKFKQDKIVINKKFIGRGKLPHKDETKAVRLFIDMIQNLYLNLDPSDHHKMGLILRLIPFINPYFNCLAKNPYEKNKEKLTPLRLGELAEKLGYTQRQCRNLGNDILSIRFGEDRQRIAIAVHLDNLNTKDILLIFNSQLFFKGNVEEYRLVNQMFETYQPNELFLLDI